jgi:hypothetical protein
MLACVLMLVVILVFDFTAIYWGADSRDDLNSPEWERRFWRAGYL